MSWFQATPTTLLLNPCYNPHPAGAPDKSDIWELSETKSSGAQEKEKNNLRREVYVINFKTDEIRDMAKGCATPTDQSLKSQWGKKTNLHIWK